MTDYIQLPRSALWSDKNLLQLYVHLALRADSNGVTRVSQRSLAACIGVSLRQIRNMLETLFAEQLAEQQTEQLAKQITTIKIKQLKPKAKQKVKQQTEPLAEQQTVARKTAVPAYTPPPFVAPEYAATWRKFVEYRREIKKPYKSESSERIAYNKMVEMAGNDPAAAKDMVERTILGQWQGLFPNKTDNYGNRKQASFSPAFRKAQRDRGLSLATAIVAGSSNLRNLYDGNIQKPDDSQNPA